MAKSFLSGQNNKSNKPKNGNKKSPLKKLPWKKIGLVAGVLALAFALGVGAFWLQNGFPEKQDNGASQEENNVPVSEIEPEGAIEESAALAFNGKYEAAQQRLEKARQNESSDERAQELVIQQATNALNAERYEEGLRYAREAIDLNDSAAANRLAGQIAEENGQLAAAAEYYRAALQKIDTDSKVVRQEVMLKQAIERVSQDG